LFSALQITPDASFIGRFCLCVASLGLNTPHSTMPIPCPLCQAPSGESIIWQSPQLRIVWGGETDHPCLVRVIWHSHATEMAHLNTAEKHALMAAVFVVESAMQQVLQPKKLNLASLGNWVAHLHWHVIPRWEDDAHWPNSIWAASQRGPAAHGVPLKPALAALIALQMNATTMPS
jgi:diadenosine tetraphosphate (Ap4A) HIT family hydrolase